MTYDVFEGTLNLAQSINACALSLPVEHRPQTTRLHPTLSCAAAFIFHQLYCT